MRSLFLKGYFIILFSLFFLCKPATAEFSGTWGTCSWTINDNGLLTVHSGVGENTYGSCPWKEYTGLINHVDMEEDILLPSDSSHLFSSFTSCTFMNLSGLNTEKISNADHMFLNCDSLIKITVGNHFSFTADGKINIYFPFGRWLSSSGQDYSTDEISRTRSNIADTYSFIVNNLSETEYHGVWGSCNWFISNNTLHISSGEGANTNSICPWSKYNEIIMSAFVEDEVILPADCSYLFRLYNCKNLDLSGADSSLVTNMEHMLSENIRKIKIGTHFSFIDQYHNILLLPCPIDMSQHVWISSTGKYLTPWQIATEYSRIEDSYQLFNVDHAYSFYKSKILTLPSELTHIETEAFADINPFMIILPWQLEYIADDAFTDQYIIIINGCCSDYTWQWAQNHPELLIHFEGNG